MSTDAASVCPRDAVHLWPLAGLAVAVMALAALGVLPTWSGLPHLVALPPLDLYADLRVLLTHATSWPWFCVVLVLVFGARVALLAFLLGGLDRQRLRFAAVLYGVALLPMLLAAELNYAAFALLYGRLFWITIALAAMTVLLLAALPWHGVTRLPEAWRRSWGGGLRAGPLAGYAVGLLLLGVLVERWPLLAVPAVVVSAGLTMLMIRLLARPPRRGAGARLAVVLIVAVSLVVPLFVPLGSSSEGAPPSARRGSVLFMSGINSASGVGAVFRVDPARWGYRCDQVHYFSYAEVGGGQRRGLARCPIRTGAPFTAGDTHRGLDELGVLLGEQVRALPGPVVVVGHSYSAWVAWRAVARGVAPEVDVLILAGAFPESTHGYLDRGVDGPGVVASDLLRAIAPLASARGFPLDPDAPAFRTMLGDRHGPARVVREPLPSRVRALSVIAATDLPLLPSGGRLRGTRNVCPARVEHADLPDSGVMAGEVNRFLNGLPSAPCPAWRSWSGVAVRPFGVPPAVR